MATPSREGAPIVGESWSEIVGVVEEVSADTLKVSATRTFRVPLVPLTNRARKLSKGMPVGVLFLPGGIRARLLEPEPDDDSVATVRRGESR